MNEIQIVHILQFQRTSEIKSNILQSIIPKDSKRLQMDAFKGADRLTKHFTLYSAIKKACRQNPLPSPYKQCRHLHHMAIHLIFLWRKFNPALIITITGLLYLAQQSQSPVFRKRHCQYSSRKSRCCL